MCGTERHWAAHDFFTGATTGATTVRHYFQRKNAFGAKTWLLSIERSQTSRV
jgi:hypothetical protein